MTYSKSESFDTDLQDIALIAKGLSHPARLAILRYLAACNECVSGDISEFIPLSRTTVSQHLQELKKLGFIQGTLSGTRVNYCLNPIKIIEIHQLLSTFFKDLEKKRSACSSSTNGSIE